MRIEETIEKSGLFQFDDGYLGSTNHCVEYYYNYDKDMINQIIDENDLKSLTLDREFCNGWWSNNVGKDWDEFWNKWFKDCPEFEVIEDGLVGGLGYGKITIDQKNKSIKIMVPPCVYTNWRSTTNDNDQKIFGFDFDTGEMKRVISVEELNVMLQNSDKYIG
jgi:hypothetical protein